MPLQGVSKPKRQRQYEHIKASYKKRGVNEDTSQRIAAATVNKIRRQKGEIRKS